jgi:hypothetical protein
VSGHVSSIRRLLHRCWPTTGDNQFFSNNSAIVLHRNRTITVANRATRGLLSRGFLTSVGWSADVCGDEIHTSREVLWMSWGGAVWCGAMNIKETGHEQAAPHCLSLPHSAKPDISLLQASVEIFQMAMAKPPLQTAAIILFVLLATASCLHTVDTAALGTCVHTTTTTTTCERHL